MRQRILCTAIHYDDDKKHSYQPINIKKGFVIIGYKHMNIKYIKQTLMNCHNNHLITQQGFLTNKNRFVDRKKALKIWKDNHKYDIDYDKKQFEGKTQLYSYDLYK